MYKVGQTDWPQGTVSAAKMLCFGLMLNIPAIAEPLPQRHVENRQKNYLLTDNFTLSYASFHRSEGLQIAGAIDDVANFWTALDNGTLFDDVSDATWAMVDAIVEKNPKVADYL